MRAGSFRRAREASAARHAGKSLRPSGRSSAVMPAAASWVRMVATAPMARRNLATRDGVASRVSSVKSGGWTSRGGEHRRGGRGRWSFGPLWRVGRGGEGNGVGGGGTGGGGCLWLALAAAAVCERKSDYGSVTCRVRGSRGSWFGIVERCHARNAARRRRHEDRAPPRRRLQSCRDTWSSACTQAK